MSEPKIGAGDIEVVIEGQTLLLKPTLECCIKMSRSGVAGPRVLSEQCMALNLDAIAFVIAAGLDKTIEQVQGPIFRTGTINVFAACIRFIHVVSNGGRPITEEDENTPKDPPVGGLKSETITTD